MVKWKTLCLENKLYYIEAAFSFFIENFARFNFAPFWSARDAIPPSNDYVFFDNSLNCFSTTTFQSAAGIYHAAVLQFLNTFILSMDAIWIEYNDHVENVNTPSFLIFTSFPLQFFLSNRRNFDILKKEMRKEMCWFSNVTFRTIQKKITRFGCRIKKKIIWSKFARAFIFFLSSEKCGSKIMWLNFQGTIFKQAFEERSELIKLFVIHTRSLFFAIFSATFSHSLQTLLRIPWPAPDYALFE